MIVRVPALSLLVVCLLPAPGAGSYGAADTPVVAAADGDNENPNGNGRKEGEYGVDVSFPIHHHFVSTNYPWLPHNVDPANNPTPPEFRDMPLQPLGNREAAYEEFIQGCVEKWGSKGKGRCLGTERDRIAMSLRQPQSMQVR